MANTHPAAPESPFISKWCQFALIGLLSILLRSMWRMALHRAALVKQEPRRCRDLLLLRPRLAVHLIVLRSALRLPVACLCACCVVLRVPVLTWRGRGRGRRRDIPDVQAIHQCARAVLQCERDGCLGRHAGLDNAWLAGQDKEPGVVVLVILAVLCERTSVHPPTPHNTHTLTHAHNTHTQHAHNTHTHTRHQSAPRYTCAKISSP